MERDSQKEAAWVVLEKVDVTRKGTNPVERVMEKQERRIQYVLLCDRTPQIL